MNEVEKWLLHLGSTLGKNEEQMRPIIHLLVQEHWFDTLDSLKNLSDEQWKELHLPIRLMEAMRATLFQTDTSQPQAIHADSPISLPSSLDADAQTNENSVCDEQSFFTELYGASDSMFTESLFDCVTHLSDEIPDKCTLIRVAKFLMKIFDTVLGAPYDHSKRKINKLNEKFQTLILSYSKAVAFLHAVGFDDCTTHFVLRCAYISRLTDAHELLDSLLLSLGLPATPLPTSAFNPYQCNFSHTSSQYSNMMKIIKVSDAELLAENANASISHQSTSVDDESDVDLNLIIFSSKSIGSAASNKWPLPKVQEMDSNNYSFFKEDLCRLKQALTDPPNFQSRAKKELALKKARKVYLKSTIRILFPDKLVMELNFKPSTTIEQVMNIISLHLKPELCKKDWTITEAPLHCRLQPTATLNDLGLVPSATLHLTFKGTPNFTLDGPYIKQESLTAFFIDKNV